MIIFLSCYVLALFVADVAQQKVKAFPSLKMFSAFSHQTSTIIEAQFKWKIHNSSKLFMTVRKYF